ncbi:MAG: DUF6464 family protein [Hormoscilla sp.]
MRKTHRSEKKTPAVLEEILLVISLGLMPSTALSVWMMYKVEGSKQQRVVSQMEISTQAMMRSPAVEQPSLEMPPPVPQLPSEHHYIEGIGLLIGDVSCYYNARSAYIRCAVNPEGPCENCPHYEPTEEKDWKD